MIADSTSMQNVIAFPGRDSDRVSEHDSDNDADHEIYRYKFGQSFMKGLFQFAKIHQYDDRHTFKDAWKVWVEVNCDEVEAEIRSLNETGYTGDIIDKMYKSARYYFRKKATTKKDPKKRRVYISLNKDFLSKMNDHVKNYCIDDKNTPADGFEDFCKTNKSELGDEVAYLYHAGITDPKDISAKIKKTYKNKYFQITHN